MSTIAWCRLLSVLIAFHGATIYARPLDHAPPPPRNGAYQRITFFMTDVLGNTGSPSTEPELEPAAGTNYTQLTPPKHRCRVPVSGAGDRVAGESAGRFPYLSSLQALEFGAVTAVDEVLREGDMSAAPLVGRARGIYVTIPEEPCNRMVALTAEFADGGRPGNSIRFFGIHQTGAGESHVAVIGGTGKYEGANGYATVMSVGSGGGASEKSLRVTVFLSEPATEPSYR